MLNPIFIGLTLHWYHMNPQETPVFVFFDWKTFTLFYCLGRLEFHTFIFLTEQHLFLAVGEEIYPKEEDFFDLVEYVEREVFV